MAKNSNNPIHSAETVAALRAATAKEEDPFVRGGDYLAKNFLGVKYKLITSIRPQKLLKRVIERISPGSYCFSIIRTKHFDDVLMSEAEKGIEQLVMLGAGYDTRAFRFKDKLEKVAVFEIDFPGTQAYKRKRLSGLEERVPSNIVFIPLDFNEESYEEALRKAGFSKAKKTLFLWEGVSYYLPETVVKNVLRFVSSCAAGSSIVFDYAIRDFVRGDRSTYGAKEVAEWLEKIKEPFLFGLNPDEVRPFLTGVRLKVISDYGPEELEVLYLRNQEGLLIGKTFGHVRMVHARKNNTN